jgi:mercuric ion transport protein
MSDEIREEAMTAQPAGGDSRRGVWGKVLLGTAALACPCHIPIYLVLFGGTALGGYLAENTGLAIAALSAYFLFALFAGLRMVKAQRTE